MSEETTAQQGAADAAINEAKPALPAPKSDAEAAQREAETVAQPEVEKTADADKQAEEKKKQGNRTREYIQRINAENAEMRRRVAEYEARMQPVQRNDGAASGPPSLEDFNYDVAEWKRADDAYNRQQWQKEQQQAEAARNQQESQARYDQRVEAFADANPDFYEAVGSIDPSFLTPELQAAIIGHEKGPEIAYHLATNEDALWNLASVRADLLPAAIGRLASRLGAAPPAQQQPAIAPALQQQAAVPKPISQVPAPPPTVGGRSPTETPPEKLTDDEWYKREAERRRKR